MAEVSPSGVATLLTLVLAGPLVYCCYYASVRLHRKFRKRKTSTEPELRPRHSSGSEDGVEQREQVGTMEYTLGLLGYAIGIGNIWRFPYLVGKYGGGAFIFAYLVCLFLVAMPMYQMEMVLGHHTRGSTVKCFATIRPRWRSIGYAQALMLFYALAYYNVLVSYATIYMMGSLQSPLPWTEAAIDMTLAAQHNQSASEYFWAHVVLNKFDSLEGQGLGPVQPKIAAALLGVWTLVFLSLVFGKAVLAKVTWVTVVGPVLLLGVLLVQTLTLDGAADGVSYYIGKFDWSRLAESEVWAVACGQILFSLSPGMGTAITMSSYTAPKEDTYRVCIFVALANSAFSLTGGFAIFSILGNLAKRTGRTVAEIAGANGPGLAFVSIADGVCTFGAGANAMAVLFFAMLLSLGLDSTFAWAETFVCYIDDFFLSIRRPRPKWQIVAFACSLLFVAGLPFCTRGGLELLDVTDRYGVSYYLLGGCFLEICMFHLDFGWDRLAAHVRQATVGNKATPKGRTFWPAAFWKLCLYVTVPVFTVVLFVQLWVQDLSRPYGGYPAGYQTFGWILLMALMLITPITMFKLDRTPGTLPESKELTQSEAPPGCLKKLLVTLGGRAPVWTAYADSSQANPSGASPQHPRPSGGDSVVELSAVVAQTPLGPNI